MTICSKMYEALDKRLEEKKSLDEIGSELCDAVIDPRGKAIRLIKAYKGEKYLKENEWLGYNKVMAEYGKLATEAEKNLSFSKDLYDDARNNGIRVDVAPRYEPAATKNMQSLQDKFEPEEIVYENDGDHPLQSCPIFYPKKSQMKMCRCGDGYCDIDEKFYTKEQIKEMKK